MLAELGFSRTSQGRQQYLRVLNSRVSTKMLSPRKDWPKLAPGFRQSASRVSMRHLQLMPPVAPDANSAVRRG